MSSRRPSGAPEEINWERLDKTKFYLYGVGIFSGVTTCLFPLSVMKTRQMALPNIASGFKGVHQTATEIWRLEGVRGFYKGFGTVCFGTVPARVVYMSTLEFVKSAVNSVLQRWNWSDIGAAGTVNFLAGASASLCSQCVYIPVDVVSQRLMVLDNPTGSNGRKMNGLSMARLIIQQEGVRGLWRGFFASIATFVPNSALWWGSYGMWQRALWHQVDFFRSRSELPAVSAAGAEMQPPSEVSTSLVAADVTHSTYDVVAVQTSAALLAGGTSACFTTPLDVIKTRLQLAEMKDGKRPTFVGTVREILRQDGFRGLMRGMVPRTANVALWGTAMVSAYEFLKRQAVVPAD